MRRAPRLRGLTDLAPSCSVRLIVGAGHPRHLAKRLAYDPETFRARVERIVSRSFPDSTQIRARGFFKNVGEPSLQIEVLDLRSDCAKFFERARCVASRIAADLEQEPVTVVAQDADGRLQAEFVGARACPARARAGARRRRRAAR